MKRTLLAVSLVLGAAASSAAHHSFAADYLEEQKVSIEGEVIAFELRSPHSWLHLMVVDERGQAQKYSVEWSHPARLRQAGFSVDSFKPGDRVIVTGSPARDPAARRLHLRTIQRPADGWRWPKSGRDDEP